MNHKVLKFVAEYTKFQREERKNEQDRKLLDSKIYKFYPKNIVTIYMIPFTAICLLAFFSEVSGEISLEHVFILFRSNYRL